MCVGAPCTVFASKRKENEGAKPRPSGPALSWQTLAAPGSPRPDSLLQKAEWIATIIGGEGRRSARAFSLLRALHLQQHHAMLRPSDALVETPYFLQLPAYVRAGGNRGFVERISSPCGTTTLSSRPAKSYCTVLTT